MSSQLATATARAVELAGQLEAACTKLREAEAAHAEALAKEREQLARSQASIAALEARLEQQGRDFDGLQDELAAVKEAKV